MKSLNRNISLAQIKKERIRNRIQELEQELKVNTVIDSYYFY